MSSKTLGLFSFQDLQMTAFRSVYFLLYLSQVGEENVPY